MMGFIRAMLCLHRWIDVQTYQKTRNSDGKPFGIVMHQRCEKCGEHRMVSL